MSESIKHYTNGDLSIVWQPELCQHSTHCFRNLPNVFNPRINPWVKPENADSAELIQVVMGCPSGALSILQAPAEPLK